MKKKYKTLVEIDERISEQLKSEKGRDNYWRSLLDECKNYDLIDLFG